MLSGRRKLLLADDSPTIQKVISLTFGDEGVEVVAVGDGESALRALAAGPPPDVLLADVVMPGPDGYALCERVKRDERLRHVPVILLVGTFEPFNEAEARRVGADTVLTKPFQSIRDLVSKVGSLLGGGEPRQEHEPDHARDDSAARGEPAAARPHAAATHADALAPDESRADAEFGAVLDERAEESAASFADLGADDELIEARPADAFGASAAGASGFTPRAESTRPFAESHGEPGLRAAQPSESNGVVAPTAFGAAAGEGFGRRRADTGVEQSEDVLTELTDERAMHDITSSQPSSDTFDARAESAAAADDTLLDLGRVDAPATAQSAEVEDFILDLDLEDEPPARRAGAVPAGEVLAEPVFESAPAARAAWADAPSAFAEAAHGEQSRAFADAATGEAASPFGSQSRGDEFETFGEQPRPVEVHARDAGAGEPWRDVVMQDGPQGFAFGAEAQAVGSAPRGFVEPEVVPADEPVPAIVEGEFTDGSVEGDVPRPPARETATAAPAAEPQAPTAAGFAVGEARAGVEESPRANQLSPEQLDAIARRVVELMSDKIVREIAWEVVPELAELVIRQRLDEDKRS
ncbi:MAG: response regulator [Acidobacteria bacterium]|nr:response regulator [Acidobacteriota bacterium]